MPSPKRFLGASESETSQASRNKKKPYILKVMYPHILKGDVFFNNIH